MSTFEALAPLSVIGKQVARLSGYAPALPTPFNETGAVDAAAFARLCDMQVHQGATALVVCGTTGEAPTLSTAEQVALIRSAVEIAHGRIPVIAGADAVLSVVPYYNTPTQAGLEAHFSAIAQSTGLPIILYDVPSRTGCGLADETIARLAENRQFIGLKDATGDMSRPPRLRALLGSHFRLLSGDDATALPFLAQGGNGCISVTSNVVPGLCRNLFQAYRQGDTASAHRWALPVSKLTAALFSETNPAPLKYALSLLGLMTATVRLPLVGVGEATGAMLARTIEQTCTDYPEFTIGEGRWPGREHARTTARLVALGGGLS